MLAHDRKSSNPGASVCTNTIKYDDRVKYCKSKFSTNMVLDHMGFKDC